MQYFSEAGYEALKVQLFCHEGFSPKPYRCTAGKLTIGIGRNLEAKGISQQEAEYLLENDILAVCSELEKTLPIFTSLSEKRKQVLVNMAFNIGVAGLGKFNKMLSALVAQDYSQAALEMLNSRWATQVGRRANELAQIMLEG